MDLSSSVRYAVIGTGPRGRALMKAAMDTGEVDIAGIADVNPASLAEAAQLAPSASQFADYRDMLSWGEFDAVVIAAPNHLHEELLMAAADTGKPILCEKPLGITMESVERLVERLRDYPSVFQIGLELRYHRMIVEMKRQLDSGRIGHPHMIWCKEFRPPFKPGHEEWRLGPKSGGSLLEKNCHHFDVFNWLIGSRPVKVSAFGGTGVVYRDDQTLDHAWVMIEYANGVKANLGLSLAQPDFYLELGVLGNEGSLVAESPDEKLVMHIAGLAEASTIRYGHLRDSGYEHGGEVEQHEAFIRAIRTGERSTFSLEAVLDAHAIAFAAEESIRTGQTVRLP